MDHIEIVLFQASGLHNLPTGHELERIAEIAELKEVSYSVHLPASLEVAAEDPDRREESVQSVLEVLHHKNPIVRKGAIEALGEIKLADPKILEGLSSLLRDGVEYVRGKAADALRSIGREALPTLIKALKKANKEMRILISLFAFLSALIKVGSASLPILRSASAAFPRTYSTPSRNRDDNPSSIFGSASLISPKASIAPFLTMGFL